MDDLEAGTQQQHRWFNELQRVSASPEIAVRCMRVFNSIDVSQLLPLVRCPTLIIHSKDDVRVPFEILQLLAKGSANADIAERLDLSQKTVRNQVSAIFDQLGVRSRGQAIVLARGAGFGQE